MGKRHCYSGERTVQILVSLLRQHGIRKVIASPGATNITFVASVQQDPWFEVYSSVDERSAAYMACGMAAESGEAVVLSCTGATASRNYMPGLTEAYYRQLPVVAVTSSQHFGRIGGGWPQVTDRRNPPSDAARVSVHIPVPSAREDEEFAVNEINRALLELRRHGGGPVHVNFATEFSGDFSVAELPKARIVRRFMPGDEYPSLPEGRIAVVTGAHAAWEAEAVEAVERFCEAHDAVVFGDHTGNYVGRHGVRYALVGGQDLYTSPALDVDLLVSVGSISGDYMTGFKAREVWRVSPDGNFHTRFGNLTAVFETDERDFFSRYAGGAGKGDAYLSACRREMEETRALVPELPFSTLWAARQTAPRLPEGCVLHLGILSSLRAWNFFGIPPSVRAYCNVGGFGIDGCLSSLVGASLAAPGKLFFCVVGDLAFFYDLNALGNRHVGGNVRIMLLNNGKGMEFRHNRILATYGEETDKYIAAAGHYGDKSPDLVRHYATDLGFEYLAASDKEEFLSALGRFVSPERAGRPMVFEVFTGTGDEVKAFLTIRRLRADVRGKAKQMAKAVLGADNARRVAKWAWRWKK